MKSAVDRLQAIGMLYTTATLNNALTSTSWVEMTWGPKGKS